MLFKSLYPRLIFILTLMSLFMFVVLVLGNAFFLREAVFDILGDLQTERINYLFAQLDRNFDDQSPVDSVQAFIASMHFEYAVYLFDRNGQYITGTNGMADVDGTGEELHEELRIDGITRVFYNPNKTAPVFAAKMVLTHPDLPIVKKVFLQIFLSILFVIAVSTLLGWWLISYLNKRLERLKEGVSKITYGDFNTPLDDSGNDEIAFLAKSFNRMAERLKNMVGTLEESNAARQRLVAHASHEIKSPLTSIKGFIDIIEYMKLLPDKQRAILLPTVKKDLGRVVKITNDMMELARIRDPEYHFTQQEIKIDALIFEEHSFFERKAAEQGAQAHLDRSLPRGMTMTTDPDRLAQILDNLWNNALKYGDLSVPIRTEILAENENLCIRISNRLRHEIPVPPEHLFEPFYRNPDNPEKVAGSGLGLSIVKELTEMLGGEVKANMSDNTMTITVLLPRQ